MSPACNEPVAVSLRIAAEIFVAPDDDHDCDITFSPTKGRPRHRPVESAGLELATLLLADTTGDVGLAGGDLDHQLNRVAAAGLLLDA